MRYFASPTWVAAGCVLIGVTSASYLAAAAWNRSGEPEAVLVLTERELPVPWGRQDERTSLDLPIVVGRPPGVMARAARWRQQTLPEVDEPWIGPESLRAVGFALDRGPSDPGAAEYYQRQIARRAWVVLEYEGEAWRRWLSRREDQVRKVRLEVEAGAAAQATLRDAEALLALDRTERSRLFPIDAGTDPVELRRRHPDRHRSAIMLAALRPRVVRPDGGEPFLTASVQLAVPGVHAPRELRRQLEPFLPEETFQEVLERERRDAAKGWPEPVAARYQVTIAIGRRFEPWLVSVADVH